MKAETLTGGCGDNLTWSLDTESGVLTISGSGAMEDYDEYGAPWPFIQTAVIEEGVISIGSYAFSGCSGLTGITIPSSVTSIGWGAFACCSGLTEYIVSEGNAVYSAKDGVLFNKEGDILISYPNAKATVYVIPDGVTRIGESAFFVCSGLTSITLPNSVTSIGEDAFSYCSGLTSITLPNSVTSIGSQAFSDCSGLTSITIPNGVTSIESWAFSGCSGLTSVTIGSGVTSIEWWAFFGCTGLTEIHSLNPMPPSAGSAFDGVPTATCRVYVPKGAIAAYEDAEGWSAFTYILEEEGPVTGICGADGNNLTWSLDTGSGVLTISGSGAMADYNWNGAPWYSRRSLIQTATIGNSVTSIGMWAFSGCSSLTRVTIPKSIVSIGWHAFDGCSGLKSITIPNSVARIGEGAFDGCTGLADVPRSFSRFPESSTSRYSERYSELAAANIEFTVSSMARDCFFYQCAKLDIHHRQPQKRSKKKSFLQWKK
ncbi:MAG: leucine-rich repeat protein [Bacteroidales bacterium]